MCVDVFVCVFVLFFFFKQKTAYEMRISDWSSDVCSSDLSRRDCGDRRGRALRYSRPANPTRPIAGSAAYCPKSRSTAAARARGRCRTARCYSRARPRSRRRPASRSEEHTSELQSLMRISYAVFCLKKKNSEEVQIITKTYKPEIKHIN